MAANCVVTSITVEVNEWSKNGRQLVTKLVQCECKCLILFNFSAETMAAKNIGWSGIKRSLKYLITLAFEEED